MEKLVTKFLENFFFYLNSGLAVHYEVLQSSLGKLRLRDERFVFYYNLFYLTES